MAQAWERCGHAQAGSKKPPGVTLCSRSECYLSGLRVEKAFLWGGWKATSHEVNIPIGGPQEVTH